MKQSLQLKTSQGIAMTQQLQQAIFLLQLSSIELATVIQEKLESIAHTEFNNEKFKNTDHIINCQKTGKDLFHRNVPAKKIDKKFFPKDLLILMEENTNYYFGNKN